MRLVKTFGLVALAALATMAYVGAATASADTLCQELLKNANGEFDHTKECPVGARVTTGAKIAGLSVNANLETGKKSTLLLNGSNNVLVECDSSVLGEVTRQGNHEPVLGLITDLKFSSCGGLCKKATAEDLPYHLEAIASELHALVSEHGAGRPAANLEECTFIGECLYKLKNATSLFKINEDEMIADKVPLTRVGTCAFLAPAEGFWDATYLITLDKGTLANPVHETPIYLVLKP